MPVLEVTQLRLRGLVADHPALLQSLSTVRDKLHTSSEFYNCIRDPTLIYILGIWPSLDAHLEFLASPARDEILGPQEHMLAFCWTIHVELGGMRLLPLDAPVLAIERLCIKGECVEAIDQVVTRHRQELRDSQPKTTHGWRCDGEPKTHEVVLFTGWETAQAHTPFAMNKSFIQNDVEVAAVNGQHHAILAWNLERKKIDLPTKQV
jgi:heme-degrading monooxygenase HmoA